MPLTKFQALQAGVGPVWIDLLKVNSIFPFVGVPLRDTKGQVIPNQFTGISDGVRDPDEVRVIGSRVGIDGQVVDIAEQPAELANQVAEACTEDLKRATAIELRPH